MYMVIDFDGDSAVGPFSSYEEADDFIAEISTHFNINKFEIYELSSPTNWVEDNFEEILMASH